MREQHVPVDVAVIGLGYVGLPLAQEATRSGLKVTGFDLSLRVVDALNAGQSHVDDLSDADIAEMLETAYKGRTVSQILDEDRYFDLVVWFDEAARRDPDEINKTILDTPSGRKIALGDVAEILDTTGPNTINRENVQRRIVVFCNVHDRDLAGVVRDMTPVLVYERDHFVPTEGDKPQVDHKPYVPKKANDSRGDIIAAYTRVTFPDGSQVIKGMLYADDIARIAASSASASRV